MILWLGRLIDVNWGDVNSVITIITVSAYLISKGLIIEEI